MNARLLLCLAAALASTTQAFAGCENVSQVMTKSAINHLTVQGRVIVRCTGEDEICARYPLQFVNIESIGIARNRNSKSFNTESTLLINGSPISMKDVYVPYAGGGSCYSARNLALIVNTDVRAEGNAGVEICDVGSMAEYVNSRDVPGHSCREPN